MRNIKPGVIHYKAMNLSVRYVKLINKVISPIMSNKNQDSKEIANGIT